MSKSFVILLVLLLGALAVSAPGTQASSQDAAQANPVKPTAESLAQGKKYYGYDCAMCHGDNGDGRGEVAMDEKLKLKDYRDPASLLGMSDEQLFNIIKDGKGQMPPEGGRLKPNELWNLVNYIRSFAHK